MLRRRVAGHARRDATGRRHGEMKKELPAYRKYGKCAKEASTIEQINVCAKEMDAALK